MLAERPARSNAWLCGNSDDPPAVNDRVKFPTSDRLKFPTQ